MFFLHRPCEVLVASKNSGKSSIFRWNLDEYLAKLYYIQRLERGWVRCDWLGSLACLRTFGPAFRATGTWQAMQSDSVAGIDKPTPLELP